jgi:hypothetical protein
MGSSNGGGKDERQRDRSQHAPPALDSGKAVLSHHGALCQPWRYGPARHRRRSTCFRLPVERLAGSESGKSRGAHEWPHHDSGTFF